MLRTFLWSRVYQENQFSNGVQPFELIYLRTLKSLCKFVLKIKNIGFVLSYFQRESVLKIPVFAFLEINLLLSNIAK